jgi:hypothetical protein
MSNAPSHAMQFDGISQSDAERLLAVIWRALEAHALASPSIEVRSAGALINIKLTFQSTEERAIVKKKILHEIPSCAQRNFL